MSVTDIVWHSKQYNDILSMKIQVSGLRIFNDSILKQELDIKHAGITGLKSMAAFFLQTFCI